MHCFCFFLQFFPPGSGTMEGNLNAGNITFVSLFYSKFLKYLSMMVYLKLKVLNVVEQKIHILFLWKFLVLGGSESGNKLATFWSRMLIIFSLIRNSAFILGVELQPGALFTFSLSL